MPTHSENQKKHHSHEIEGVKGRHTRAARLQWWKVLLLMIVGGLLALVFTPYAGKAYRKLIRFQGAEKKAAKEVSSEPRQKVKAPGYSHIYIQVR